MARNFDGISQLGTATTAAVTLDTGTFACWCRPDFASTTATQYYWFHTDTTNYFALLNASGQFQTRFDGRNRNFDVSWSASDWIHIAVTYDKGADSILGYLNGSAMNPQGAPTGTWGTNTHGTNVYLGRSTSSGFFDGRFAEVVWYSAVLTASDIAALGKGFAPTLVRPNVLNAYWPLMGNESPELDRWENKYNLTLTDTPAKADHIRIYYPHQVP